MKLFCGLGTGELIQSWFSEMKIVEAGWYQQIEDEGLKITFLPAQHWSKRSVRDVFIIVVIQGIPAIFVRFPICSVLLIMLC